MKKFTEKIIISTDFLNPCVNICRANGAKFQISSIKKDLAIMIYSKNFMLARSSFSKSVLYLSPFQKNFWVFDDAANFEEFQTDFFNCESPQDYLVQVMKNFSPTPLRLEFMKNSTCFWNFCQFSPNQTFS